MAKLFVMKTPTQKKERKTEQVKVSLTAKENERLLALAEMEDLPHSTLARRFVLKGLHSVAQRPMRRTA